MILGIDTATTDTVVGVCDGDDCNFEAQLGPGADGRPVHGVELLSAVMRAVESVGGWDSIERIAVGIGPGSFTGVRIGISIARALAQARGLPVAGVRTTAALCEGIGGGHPGAVSRPLVGVVDARRGELFAAVDRGEGASEPVLAVPDAVAEELGLAVVEGELRPLAAGEGAVRCRVQLEATGIEVLADDDPAHRVSAKHVCALGSRAQAGPPDAVVPDYMRRPDAERWIERRRGN